MVYTDKIHIIADKESELHQFARRIGLGHCWFDFRSNPVHYDFPKKYSGNFTRQELIERAIAFGAIEFPDKWKMIRAYRANNNL